MCVPITVNGKRIAMLGFAYQTWTRDTSVKETTGKVVVWNEKAADLQAIVHETKDRTIKIDIPYITADPSGPKHLAVKVTRADDAPLCLAMLASASCMMR